MITVEKMRDLLNKFINHGLGNRNITVGEYYIGEEYNSSDDDDIWNTISFEGIHQSDVPLTDEQQKLVDSDLEKMKKEHPDLFKPF